MHFENVTLMLCKWHVISYSVPLFTVDSWDWLSFCTRFMRIFRISDALFQRLQKCEAGAPRKLFFSPTHAGLQNYIIWAEMFDILCHPKIYLSYYYMLQKTVLFLLKAAPGLTCFFLPSLEVLAFWSTVEKLQIIIWHFCVIPDCWHDWKRVTLARVHYRKALRNPRH